VDIRVNVTGVKELLHWKTVFPASIHVRRDIIQLPEVPRELDMSLVRELGVPDNHRAVLPKSARNGHGSSPPTIDEWTSVSHFVDDFSDLSVQLGRHGLGEVDAGELGAEGGVERGNLEARHDCDRAGV
jgi:hypothetical protein